ncbi:hypothetical protein ACTSEZ_16355 [Metabacillus sp. JX24]|uniref:hypothetical protein n=1 Tax=Metabacillus sp. JX24 TaxID=3240759 RepID=UPI003510BC06
MENKILLEKLKLMPELRLNKHQKSDLINGECVTRSSKQRRRNVVGDINPNGRSFLLYKDGKWRSKNKLGIKTIDQAIEHIRKDIEHLSK